MSKTVRIKEHLYAEIEALARTERRSLVAQLEILLEQALRMDDPPIAKETVETIRRLAGRASLQSDDHFKPDPKR